MKQRLYLICTLERTGSDYLCWLLRSTRRMGDPREWYNDRQPRLAHVDRTGMPFLETLAAETASPNGVFGIKVMLGCLGRFGVLGQWSEVCQRYAPRLVWLRRRDRLRQAISRYRAIVTDQWQLARGDAPRGTRVPFDAAAIWDSYHKIEHWEQCWESDLRQLGVRPLAAWYEDVVADPQGAVEAICGLVGVRAPAVQPARCPLAVQRDELTELWVRRLGGGATSDAHAGRTGTSRL